MNVPIEVEVQIALGLIEKSKLSTCEDLLYLMLPQVTWDVSSRNANMEYETYNTHHLRLGRWAENEKFKFVLFGMRYNAPLLYPDNPLQHVVGVVHQLYDALTYFDTLEAVIEYCSNIKNFHPAYRTMVIFWFLKKIRDVFELDRDTAFRAIGDALFFDIEILYAWWFNRNVS